MDVDRFRSASIFSPSFPDIFPAAFSAELSAGSFSTLKGYSFNLALHYSLNYDKMFLNF